MYHTSLKIFQNKHLINEQELKKIKIFVTLRIRIGGFYVKRIFILSMISFLLLGVSGCMKKALSTDEFQAKMEELGYVVEINNGSGEQSSEVEEMAIASKGNYEIKFYVLSNSGSAIDFSERIKQEWQNNANYTDIKRNDNTLVVINVNPEYESIVKEDIKSLGY